MTEHKPCQACSDRAEAAIERATQALGYLALAAAERDPSRLYQDISLAKQELGWIIQILKGTA